jgi:hypothetical protein
MLFGQDPRRIKYEIYIENASNSEATVDMGTLADIDAGNTVEFQIIPLGTMVITRNFLTDLDTVTLEQWVTGTSDNIGISIRETFLTPAPIDEGP